VLAFIAVLLAMTTGSPLFDVRIDRRWLLLVIISIAMSAIASMIVGDSAEPAMRAAIEQHVRGHPEVKRVINLITLQWGAQIVVAVRAEMAPVATADELIAAVNRVEDSLQRTFPQAVWVFFEPDR
jgi:divalent metal cation (Fe/Co/Zn/Cd) transporter